MRTRVIIFGDLDLKGNLYSLYLRSKGYEVLHFSSPITCTLVTQQSCTCSRNHVCADIIITELEMEGMSGFQLIRHQFARGCKSPPQNKAVLNLGLTKEQELELKSLGCKCIQKPFRLIDLIEWIDDCEKRIPPHRKLVPSEELIASASLELFLQTDN
jgi:CheY-like chemotaxis protein